LLLVVVVLLLLVLLLVVAVVPNKMKLNHDQSLCWVSDTFPTPV
jgi:hypothetical protein